MPYSASVFYDGAPPQLTAAELNKMGAGVARAQATADTATTAATAATTAATAAATAVTGRSRALRTSDGPVLTGTTLTADPVLTITLTGVASKLFLVTFSLVYNADANCLGSIGFSASNGATPPTGADAYLVSFSKTATNATESMVGSYYVFGTTPATRANLPGNLGSASPSPRIVTGYAHVRNGTSTSPLVLTFGSSESIALVDRAAVGSGMQLLAGSVMTVEQLN